MLLKILKLVALIWLGVLVAGIVVIAVHYVVDHVRARHPATARSTAMRRRRQEATASLPPHR